MKRSFLLFCCISSLFNCFSQNRNNIWYFGQYAGINFNTNPPSALYDSKAFAYESSATISDNNGNLVFYSNGDTIWNRNHTMMLNGGGLKGGAATSSTQGVLIVPQPCNNDIYFVFVVPEKETGTNDSTFYYSIVDMTQDGGLGAVTIKNIPIHTPVNEKLTATLQADNNGYWIVVQERQTGNILAYGLTGTGLNLNPVVSPIGSLHPTDFAGYMKFSHDRTRLCTANLPDRVKIFDFNSTTGVVSNPISLAVARPYGVEFSPDNSKLYISSLTSGRVYQYDLSLASQTAIENSQITIAGPSGTFGALKSGPDNKIYVNRFLNFYVGVIDQPNQPGIACNYIEQAVFLTPKRAGLGFPNSIEAFSTCNPCVPVVSNDVVVTICDGQTYQAPSGTMLSIPGTYQDTIRNHTGTCDSIISTIHLSVVSSVSINTNVQICSNQTYQLPSGTIVHTAGIYSDTIRSMGSCDSIINNFHVSLIDISYTSVVDSIYGGQTYILPSGQLVHAAGVYQSILINSAGCDSVITTHLKLRQIAECLTLKNAFTPNRDGINDHWILYSYACFKKLEVSVYNRYGSLVYHSNDYKNDWSGNYKNRPIPDGTYYYAARITSFDGREYLFKNNVTILR